MCGQRRLTVMPLTPMTTSKSISSDPSTHFLPFSHNLNEVFGVACNNSIQFIHLVIGLSDVAILARDINHKILLRVSIMTTLLTCRRASGLTTLQHFYDQTSYLVTS